MIFILLRARYWFDFRFSIDCLKTSFQLNLPGIQQAHYISVSDFFCRCWNRWWCILHFTALECLDLCHSLTLGAEHRNLCVDKQQLCGEFPANQPAANECLSHDETGLYFYWKSIFKLVSIDKFYDVRQSIEAFYNHSILILQDWWICPLYFLKYNS